MLSEAQHHEGHRGQRNLDNISDRETSGMGGCERDFRSRLRPGHTLSEC